MIQDKIRELVQYGLLTGLVSAEDEIYTIDRVSERRGSHHRRWQGENSHYL